MNKDFRTVTRKDGTTSTYLVGETRKQVVNAIKEYAKEKGLVFNTRERIGVTTDKTSAYGTLSFGSSGCLRMSVFCDLTTFEIRWV